MLRFAFVGVGATAVHATAYLGWARLGVPPLVANLLAFAIAVTVSFAGHFHWTFLDARGGRDRRYFKNFFRFAAVATLGLVLNTIGVYVVTVTLALPYEYAAIPMVTVVPLVLFFLNRYWAFA